MGFISDRCCVCESRHSVSQHFGAPSCPACAAFFRRTVALNIKYKCREQRQCRIFHELRMRCRACRYEKCIARGLKREQVQKRRDCNVKRRSSVLSLDNDDDLALSEFKNDCTSPVTVNVDVVTSYNMSIDECISETEKWICIDAIKPITGRSSSSDCLYEEGLLFHELVPDFTPTPVRLHELRSSTSSSMSSAGSSCDGIAAELLLDQQQQSASCVDVSEYIDKRTKAKEKPLKIDRDTLIARLVTGQYRANDYRRIMYTNHPIHVLMANKGDFPFAPEELKVFTVRKHRESIRVELMLAFEYATSMDGFHQMPEEDQMHVFRCCVSMFLILDVCYISSLIGFAQERLIYPNGTYINLAADGTEGWEAEEDLSAESKRELYYSMRREIFDRLVIALAQLQLNDVEYALLKALTMWRICCSTTLSPETRAAKVGHETALIEGLHEVCRRRDDCAERIGNIILFISNFHNVFQTVKETYLMNDLFNLVEIDQLLHQVLFR